ncbi:APA family basic amino acid/polyamine antiporter [Actinomadura luteofluorescens]|uniref:APA family basic amino acid/polyamine antiporter n=1 Tax=Actinomadura luteofluorescens TaxID=46163 RepID=A0A7Y9JLN2_9ACTN|nr:APC family permease [Actinomadura luteofluorescens]NYD52748.1 APA family basic amino acid/polyamine antiporter [Actinomadura luteofluorescens]
MAFRRRNRGGPETAASGAGRPGGDGPGGDGQGAGGASDGGDALARRLGTGDAVLIGLGSMVGAGVFAVFGPAARVAGTGLLVGLVVAAVVAYCNAVASAQLAAVYPTSGGTYVYGRERLGSWWGFAAGWGFVVGKTASCAAMALTFASYAVPGPGWVRRAVAAAAVVALASLNYRGVTRTALLTRVLVVASLSALAVVVAGIAVGGQASAARLGGWAAVGEGGAYGVLQAAGLLFFAFAGYARIATMGEEVRDPERTIPRAIPVALFIAVAVYLVVGAAALLAAGPRVLAGAAAPLAAAVEAAGAGALAPVVRAGAALASLGALLALIAGIGRTSLAMARHRDLPGWLAAVHPRYRVPHHAEVAVAVVVCGLVAAVDLRGVIGFSSFGVLVYYAVANASAFTQPARDRRWPRALNVLGAAGCVVLVAALPWTSVLAGAVMFAVGLGGRWLVLRRRRPGASGGVHNAGYE